MHRCISASDGPSLDTRHWRRRISFKLLIDTQLLRPFRPEIEDGHVALTHKTPGHPSIRPYGRGSLDRVYCHPQRMTSLTRLGVALFTLPIIGFGIQYLIYGQFRGGLPPVPPWIPGGTAAAYLTGAFLIIASVSMLAGFRPRTMAILLGAFFLLCALLLHSTKIPAIIHDGTERTRFLEPLSIGAAAWILARMFPSNSPALTRSASSADALAKIGLYVYAFSMIIFGVQHFMYAPFIATLEPAWIPAHLFFVYFTGAGFIAAGLALAANFLARPGARGLGLMFFLWTILLHAPRVHAKPHNGDEWSSLFVAMALAGASFILAESARNRASG
jgi:uncharacterized membrane protein YphA (DoxX/SURF4 family)